ncbi:TraR/DksA family transcriptional regulator [Kribbella sp. C-35]|uniref:TraR/DksA family transcriptional regulator n=1 Tax=Kribbella sp. C-35 TaxID=2789276 RepID=UPI00397C0D0E
MTEPRRVVPTGENHCRWDLDVAAFRADLEQHRRFRVEQLDELTADVSAGSNEVMDEVTSALMAAAETALTDIDAALHRIDQGSFGLCRACGSAIALDRLMALPMASLCMLCQHARDTSGAFREQTPWRRRGMRPISAQPSRTVPPPSAHAEPQPHDIVDVWGYDSFPASDPPANW